MNIRNILFILIAVTITSFAQARKPAVEDFVGIESESYSSTTPGTEVLFDFSKKLPTPQTNSVSTYFSFITLLSLIAFPFLMWNFLTKQQRKEKKTKNIIRITSLESSLDKTKNQENVKYLKDYKNSDSSEKKKAS